MKSSIETLLGLEDIQDELPAELLPEYKERMDELQERYDQMGQTGMVNRQAVERAVQNLDVVLPEQYPIRSFTEQDSPTNVTVAQESFASTLIDGAVRLWKAFVEQVKKFIGWLKAALIKVIEMVLGKRELNKSMGEAEKTVAAVTNLERLLAEFNIDGAKLGETEKELVSEWSDSRDHTNAILEGLNVGPVTVGMLISIASRNRGSVLQYISAEQLPEYYRIADGLAYLSTATPGILTRFGALQASCSRIISAPKKAQVELEEINLRMADLQSEYLKKIPSTDLSTGLQELLEATANRTPMDPPLDRESIVKIARDAAITADDLQVSVNAARQFNTTLSNSANVKTDEDARIVSSGLRACNQAFDIQMTLVRIAMRRAAAVGHAQGLWAAYRSVVEREARALGRLLNEGRLDSLSEKSRRDLKMALADIHESRLSKVG